MPDRNITNNFDKLHLGHMLPLIPLGLLNQEDPECPVGESDPVSDRD